MICEHCASNRQQLSAAPAVRQCWYIGQLTGNTWSHYLCDFHARAFWLGLAPEARKTFGQREIGRTA